MTRFKFLLPPSSFKFFGASLVLIVGMAVAVGAEGYLGASAALRKVEERNASTNAPDAKADECSKLRSDLKDFSKTVPSLSSTEAAKRWLELVDRAGKISPPPGMTPDSMRAPSSMPIRADELLGALPPPPAWDELAKAIVARPPVKGSGEVREIGLRILASTLTANPIARKREIAALQAKAEKADAQSAYFYRNIFEQINEAMLAMTEDPDATLKSLEQQLKTTRDHSDSLRVPNLIPMVGPEKTEAFLRRALQQPDVELDFDSPNETSRLAQSLALQLIDKLKTPQWGLVNSLDAVDLYEALDNRFGKEKPDATTETNSQDFPKLPDIPGGFNDYRQGQAQIYYLLGLIAKDRAKEAVAVAERLGKQGETYLPEEAFKAMERAGYTSALDSFFYELLSKDPSLPFWDQYVPLAAKAGQTERMVALARASAAREDLSKNKKTAIYQTLFKALLAADQIEEGVKEMRQLIEANASATRTRNSESPGQLGVMLARIGVLTKNPEWTEEGIKVSKKWLGETENEQSSEWVAPALAEILLELDRGPEAESVLVDALAKAVRSGAAGSEYAWSRTSASLSCMTALAVLYHKAGRHADVVLLLEQTPYWGAKDLSKLSESSARENWINLRELHAPVASLPLPGIAAGALSATGRKDEATRINNALLDAEPGSDCGYEFLVAAGGENLLARLDELFARDQFEERPLIWKAHVLRQQGKLEEAEKIARQAISIDPSDGEEGPGDRMRAYAELADIREARGDKKEADFFREAVKAIRLSEEADKFYMAGLLKRAVKMYEDSLNHFADAYCIQSRLAIQLAALGLNEAAEEHYRRAYELMPDSFGRVESHCFGCERAFDGERAQSIAEKVFTKLATERPDKPQVHYLLGYLREEQENYGAARTSYQTAVRLDPDYLNAWVKIQGVSDHVQMPTKEREAVVFNILRLDPLRRHATCVSFNQVTDLAQLWNVVAAASKHRAPKPDTLLELTASKVFLEKKEKESTERSMRARYEEEFRVQQNDFSPAQAIGQTSFVRLAGQMIARENSSMVDE